MSESRDRESANGRFRAAYRAALARHLVDGGEGALRAAYELGRDAVERDLSVLDLAALHHEALLAALRGKSDRAQLEHVAEGAADFFLESLSAFEMVRRGFAEAQEAAILERRHAQILRQLSNLLADASLALGASDSLEEMLQLVAEQARELTDARFCLVTAARGARGGPVEATSYAEPEDPRWSVFVEPGALLSVYARLRPAGGPLRMSREELHQDARARTLVPVEGEQSFPGWLGAALTALDGRALGSIQLLDKQDGDFTELDEAILVHLAQMAAAALERAHHYQRR